MCLAQGHNTVTPVEPDLYCEIVIVSFALENYNNGLSLYINCLLSVLILLQICAMYKQTLLTPHCELHLDSITSKYGAGVEGFISQHDIIYH